VSLDQRHANTCFLRVGVTTLKLLSEYLDRVSGAAAFGLFMDRLETEQSLSRLHRSLLDVANGTLSGQLQGRVDAEDLLQSAYRTLFRRLSVGALELRDENSLRAMLHVIVRRKAINQFEHQHAERRDVTRTVSLDRLDVADSHGPEDSSAASELQQYLKSVLNAADYTILERLSEAATIEEIAAEIGSSRRSVSRSLERIRKRVQEILRADPERV
jgi:RNA polymerase sigma-70 factor (ECF subfamily)